jgi:hypothetical protein
MQCAKPLLILSVTLAAKNDIQTPTVEVYNKASFAYGSTLGLQRSRKLTQNLVDSVDLEQMKDSVVTATVVPKADTRSSMTSAGHQASSSLGLEDVSVLGLQRSFTVTKRAVPDPEMTKTVEDDVKEHAAQQADSQFSVGDPVRSTLGLEDVSVLGLQRSFSVTKRASLPKEDPEMKDSVFGLQRSTTLTPKAAPPTEDPDVEPIKGTKTVSSATDSSIAGASLLGQQQWTSLSRGQSAPTEDTDDSQDQEGNGTNNYVSSLGLQIGRGKISQRPAVIDDHESGVLVQEPQDNLMPEMDLNFEDVSVLGLQRSAQVKSRANDPTTSNSKDAVLGLQRSKKLTRGQAAPVEEAIASMVIEV